MEDDKQLTAFLMFPYFIDKAGCNDSLNSLNQALTYLFGKEGELTVENCRTVNKNIYGDRAPEPSKIDKTSSGKIAQSRSEATKLLPSRRIVTQKTGDIKQTGLVFKINSLFKLLGQRFSWDAYIFNQLTTPNVDGRTLPSPYDAMDILGSGSAHDFNQLVKSNNWPHYESQLEFLRTDFNNRDDKESTFYDNWLEVVKTLFAPWKCAQRFCQSPEWGYKCLNTGLATWTELKHISILYGEQSGAEAGEGPGLEAPPYDPARAQRIRRTESGVFCRSWSLARTFA